MKRLFGVTVWGAMLATALPAFAQTAATPPPPASAETRPATTTVAGDTGLWFVPTAEVMGNRKWSVSYYRQNADFGQGFTDVTHFPATLAVGLGNRVELFGSFEAITRIDRDTRPIFFTATDAPSGANGGIVNEYPLVTKGWIGNRPGDLRPGAKINLRLLLAPDATREVVLHEAEVFACVQCGKPFATKQMIEAMVGRLQNHAMFSDPGALARLKMCGDCRVRDMFGEGRQATIFDFPSKL